jgi:1-acyl-sn-glycerol-3-phosphate acyltransferase
VKGRDTSRLTVDLGPQPVPLKRVGPLDYVVSVLLWIIGLLWIVPMMTLMMLVSVVIPSDRTEWLSRLYTRVQVALTGSRWRAVVHPKVDPNTVYMFMQNHTNHFDHVVMYTSTPHFKQGIELEKHFSYPIYGWFMKKRGTIPVRRGEAGAKEHMLARMREEVQKGHSILAFPEGTRTRSGRLSPLKTGLFFAARDLGLAIVPVSVTGMYEVMRPGSLLIRPGYTVTVHVGEPIPTAGVKDAEIPRLMQRVSDALAQPIDAYWEERRRKRSERRVL